MNRLRRVLATRVPRGSTAYNAAWLFGGQVIGLLATVIATPIQLDGMGSERYGIVVLTSATIGSASLIDIAGGWAVMRSASWHRAQGNREHARRIAGSGLLLAATAGAFGTILLFALSGPLVDLFRLSSGVHQVALDALRISAFVLPFVLVNSVLAGIGRVAGMFRATALSAVVIVVPLNIVWAVVAGRDDDVVLVAATQLALTCLVTLGWLALLRLRAREYLFPVTVGRGASRELLGFGAKALGGQAGTAVLYQADKMVLGALLPVAALPTYSIPFSLASRITLVSSSLAGAMFPRMSAIAARGDTAEIRRVGRAAFRVLAALGGLLTTLCIFAGHAFLELWIDAGFADDAQGPLVALAIGFAATTVGTAGGLLLDAAGRVGTTATLTAGGAALGLGLATAGAAAFDTTLAAATGVAIGLVTAGGSIVAVSYRLVLRLPYRDAVRTIGLPWLLIAAAGGAAHAVASLADVGPWGDLLAVAAAAGAVAATRLEITRARPAPPQRA
jgi:O-antigen/teichoic acid export membrane protein